MSNSLTEVVVTGWERVVLPPRESYSPEEEAEMESGLADIKESINPGCVFTLEHTLKIRNRGVMTRWERQSDFATLFNAYMRKQLTETDQIRLRCLGCSVDIDQVLDEETEDLLTADLVLTFREMEQAYGDQFAGIYFYYETADPKVLFRAYETAMKRAVLLYTSTGGERRLALRIERSEPFTTLSLETNGAER